MFYFIFYFFNIVQILHQTFSHAWHCTRFQLFHNLLIEYEYLIFDYWIYVDKRKTPPPDFPICRTNYKWLLIRYFGLMNFATRYLYPWNRSPTDYSVYLSSSLATYLTTKTEKRRIHLRFFKSPIMKRIF